MTNNQPDAQPAHVQRRGFLQMTAAAGVAGGLSWQNSARAAHGQSRGENAETFQRCVGAKFKIHSESGEVVPVRLREVHTRPFDPNRPLQVRRDPFLLIFVAPPDTEFADQTAVIHHPDLGPIESFVSRVGPERPRGIELQAVFG